MTDQNTPPPVHAAASILGGPSPAFEIAAYTAVTIVKTVTVGGHDYRRGSQPLVDAETLAALKAVDALLD